MIDTTAMVTANGRFIEVQLLDQSTTTTVMLVRDEAETLLAQLTDALKELRK